MILALLITHLYLLTHTKFTLWPEMVVYPFLLNNGFSLYKDIINPYPPFFTNALAVFAKMFGYNPLAYQILTWSTILIIDLVVYFIAKKIYKKNIYAISSLLFFIILSVPFGINGLWFDLIQTPFILISNYFFFTFLKEPKSKHLIFWSIFFLTISFFIKQQAIWLLPWFLILLVYKFGKNSISYLAKVPFFLPFLILLLVEVFLFWKNNSLPEFMFWTIYFPAISSKMPGYISLPTTRQFIVIASLFLLFTPLVFKKKFIKNVIIFNGLLLVLFIYPRFDFFHLVPSISVLSISFGENFKLFFKTNLLTKTAFLISLSILLIFSARYFSKNWTKEVRFFENDILKSASILKKMTYQSEPIYIQNGPDQLLPLSNRIPPKPWADEFPWYLEIPGIQDKIVAALKDQNPRYIVYKSYEAGDKFEIGSYRPDKISSYLENNYQNLFTISSTLWLKYKN